jgi:hypothetical protein
MGKPKRTFASGHRSKRLKKDFGDRREQQKAKVVHCYCTPVNVPLKKLGTTYLCIIFGPPQVLPALKNKADSVVGKFLHHCCYFCCCLGETKCKLLATVSCGIPKKTSQTEQVKIQGTSHRGNKCEFERSHFLVTRLIIMALSREQNPNSRNTPKKSPPGLVVVSSIASKGKKERPLRSSRPSAPSRSPPGVRGGRGERKQRRARLANGKHFPPVG